MKRDKWGTNYLREGILLVGHQYTYIYKICIYKPIRGLFELLLDQTTLQRSLLVVEY